MTTEIILIKTNLANMDTLTKKNPFKRNFLENMKKLKYEESVIVSNKPCQANYDHNMKHKDPVSSKQVYFDKTTG